MTSEPGALGLASLAERLRSMPNWVRQAFILLIAAAVLVALRTPRPLPAGEYTGMTPSSGGPTDDNGMYVNFDNIYTALLGQQYAQTTGETQWQVGGTQATASEFDRVFGESAGSLHLVVGKNGDLVVIDAEGVPEPSTPEPQKVQ